MGRRWLPFAAVWLTLVLGRSATAAPPSDREPEWTEQRVVEHALRRVGLTDALEGSAAAERGRGIAANSRPLPQITYLREQTYGRGGTGEDYLSLAQTFRLGMRPRVRSDAAQARARAAQRDGDVTRMQIAADARSRFYDVVHRDARLIALQAWVARIDEMLGIVERRERGGEAATYDRRRLERERAVASGRVAGERAALVRAQARLAAIVGADTRPRVNGRLLPESEADALPQVHAASAKRPDLLALDERTRAAALDEKALSRAWLPDLRLEAGWKGVGMPGQGRADGFMANAMLSFSPRRLAYGLREAARGEARAARGRRALLASELDGELSGVHAEAVALRRAALELREDTEATNGDLVRIATAGYQGGELGLLELLDAYRGAAEDALAVVDMEAQARRARIELERLSGVMP